MRTYMVPSAFLAAMMFLAGRADVASAEAENLSCIIDGPQAELRVLRDCENTYVPVTPTPVYVPPLTPSELPTMEMRQGESKADRADRSKPSGGGAGGGGQSSGPNGTN